MCRPSKNDSYLPLDLDPLTMFGYPFDFLTHRLGTDCTNVTSPVINDVRGHSSCVGELLSIREPAMPGDYMTGQRSRSQHAPIYPFNLGHLSRLHYTGRFTLSSGSASKEIKRVHLYDMPDDTVPISNASTRRGPLVLENTRNEACN